jgi:hypothetical protein
MNRKYLEDQEQSTAELPKKQRWQSRRKERVSVREPGLTSAMAVQCSQGDATLVQHVNGDSVGFRSGIKKSWIALIARSFILKSKYM